MGAVAYKLELPQGSRIHDVVHVSQLKRHLPPQHQVSDISTISVLTSDSSVQPLAVLASRSIQRGGVAVPQVQVIWDTASPPSMTWEDKNSLRQRFPQALAWGQASSQGGGHVTAQPMTDSIHQKAQAQAGEGRLAAADKQA